jgi:hypothetical protein
VFPYHATLVAAHSHILEIVTPPDHILQGFILDIPDHGRTVYVHLPPPHYSTTHADDALAPHFSDVLRPHQAQAHASSFPTLTTSPVQIGSALNIRESLTALLDLASESLFANHLILVLDKDDREPERLGELLHALMYVGGAVVKPGALEGGWEWDARQWVLVGMEL